jgi:hypothetical protein
VLAQSGSAERLVMSSQALPNSDVEAGVALSRYAPSGPRSLTPVVRPTNVRGGVSAN